MSNNTSIQKTKVDREKLPTLAEVIGADPGSFANFIHLRDEALQSRQKKYEEQVREALQVDLAWAE
jgi:hypothetical protein